MKLPIGWLKDWIDCEGSPEAVADALTRRGFYVEGVESHGRAHPGVVVARVIEAAKHPNADKLSLCRVSAGGEELRVVCGAPNVRSGMIVPLATVGTVMPNGMEIRKSRIRGEESQGMLCSARELEMSDDHQGILDLEALLGSGARLEPGRPLDELLPPPDAVLEVEVPFNRPDGLGIVGLAREVKAALGGRWTDAARARLANRWGDAASHAGAAKATFDLELEDAEGCPRYIAQVIEGVKVGPAPDWMKRRLESAGQRSINNLVDLTNFVLLELGQPLHAFDLDRLRGPAIRVRRAREGERITTLDGRDRALSPEVLVIADRERPVAVAGVMGGADSEVTADTTRLLLECAWFQPQRVRRGSRALALSSEASKRFERGVDPELAPLAAARFLSLLREMSLDVSLGAARERNQLGGKRRTLTLRTSRVQRLTGLALTANEAKRHLEALEFGVDALEPLRVTVPSWRVDVTLEDDLVEEVARSEGYDRIPEAPLETHGVHAHRSPREVVTARAREAMRARGLSEAWCTTLVSEREAESAARLLGDDPPRLVRLSNAMSRDFEVLRPNLVPGLLRAVAHNLKQGAPAVRLFEVGAAFRAGGGALPEERTMLAAVVTGPRYAHAHDGSQAPVDFAEAKGLWEGWLDEMRVDTPGWRAYSAAGWKPGASAEVASGASSIGWAGTLSQPLLREWDIEVPLHHDVHLFVALLDPLFRAPAVAAVTLPGRFPPVRRDLAFFVPESVTHGRISDLLAKAGGEWLASIEVFDVYAGPGTPHGMKSLAYALAWQHPERTLAESEVQSIQQRMVALAERECGAQLREK